MSSIEIAPVVTEQSSVSVGSPVVRVKRFSRYIPFCCVPEKEIRTSRIGHVLSTLYDNRVIVYGLTLLGGAALLFRVYRKN